MKIHAVFLLSAVVVFSACTPANIAAPSAIPAATTTIVPTQTLVPAPTETLTPKSVPISVTEFELNSCSRVIRAKKSDANTLEITYADRGGFLFELPEGFSGLINADFPTRLWLWHEDTREAMPFFQPSNALSPRLSDDQRWIVFRRDTQEYSRSELWVVDTQGQNEKKLATISFDEIRARNPDLNIQYANLGYGWIPNVNQIYYYVELGGSDIENHPSTYDSFSLIDIQSEKTISLLRPGSVSSVVFSPDGSQVAVLTALPPPVVDASNQASQPAALYKPGELNLINTRDGSVEFTLPIPLRNTLGLVGTTSLDYSPDGNFLIGFTYDGIVRIDTKSGKWQTIPLDYSVLIGARSYAYSYGYIWTGSSTMLVSLTTQPQGAPAINYEDYSRASPELSFTLWQINLNAGLAQPIQTFTGFATPYSISADGRYLAMRVFPEKAFHPSNGKYAVFQLPGASLGGGGAPNIILFDITTGHEIQTLEAIEFFAWSPYSELYTYGQYYGDYQSNDGFQAKPFHISLGCIATAPVELGTYAGNPIFTDVRWVDENTLLLGCKIILLQ